MPNMETELKFEDRLEKREEESVSLSNPQIMVMRLCEQNFVILKPDQLYVFTYDPSCPSCHKVKDQLDGK